MTDHKFTDDDVIKALECCTNCICNHAKTDTECPLVKMDFCKNYLMKQSLSLINSQKVEIESLKIANEKMYSANKEQEAEIERLNKEVDRLSQCVLYHDGIVSDLEKDVFNAKAEAYKEFAERLKANMSNIARMEYGGHIYFCVGYDLIDTLVKEMTEVDNG